MKLQQLVLVLLGALSSSSSSSSHAVAAAASRPQPQAQPQAPLLPADDDSGDALSPKDTRYLFANRPPSLLSSSSSSSPHQEGYRIPTSYESAVQGRRILALTPLATLTSVYPTSPYTPPGWEHRPVDVAGTPSGLMEYIADCETDPGAAGGAGDVGNPTVLAVLIAPPFQNVRDGRYANVSLALQWTPPYPPASRIGSEAAAGGGAEAGAEGGAEAGERAASVLDSVLGFFGLERRTSGRRQHSHRRPHHPHRPHHHHPPTKNAVSYSAANLPRFSLHGYLEEIPVVPETSTSAVNLSSCFVAAHPDARYWLPGSGPHTTAWRRLVVEHVYWIGGFGDRAFIGWIPVDEWRNVTRDEWQAVRLPGEEEGWREEPIGDGDGARAAWATDGEL